MTTKVNLLNNRALIPAGTHIRPRDIHNPGLALALGSERLNRLVVPELHLRLDLLEASLRESIILPRNQLCRFLTLDGFDDLSWIKHACSAWGDAE
ncbi:hypothetical protein G7Y89_g12050 [Cudoniella acicularis]|uniref:Uncharacterized protein n=1 Tax=Cudoniella acicularis TaxID=354080 RepID=A0A8H4VXE5_9HELO|nr:hypothetical protein G7Y89_g12050 [Cudoniella acicularis]